MNKKFVIGATFILILFAVLAFGKLPFTFFQQDEWAVFGHYLFWDKANLDIIQRLFLHQQVTHLIPLTHIFSYLQFNAFGLNFAPYGLTSIVLHIMTAFLVFYLAHLLTRKRTISILAGLFFLTNSNSHQAVTWIATTTGTVGSTIFLLLSLLFYAKFLFSSQKTKRNLLVSLVLFSISLGFKETSLFLFFFLPVFWLIYRKESFWKVRKIATPIFWLGLVYFLVRVFFVFLGQPIISSSPSLSQPSFFVYGYRLFANPIKVLAQTIIPTSFILQAAGSMVRLSYPQFVTDNIPDPFIVESVGADMVSFLSSILILIVCFLFFSYFQRVKEYWLSKGIILSVLFILLSPLPLVVIPGKAGYFSLVDGRHLYVTGIFSSILLAIIFYGFFQAARRFQLAPYVLIGVAALFIGFHLIRIRHDINQQVDTGLRRKSILNKVSEQYPKLPAKAIFYIESDKAYYGLPASEKILPFQSGFGQTLLVWYDQQEQRFPACMYEGRYLYDLLSEGYKECEDRGFGYFRKMENLRKAVKENEFLLENIIAFNYNSSTNSLINITPSQLSLYFSD